MKITGMKIHRVEVSPRGDWIFVEVETDAGIAGVGEASQSGDDRLTVSALEQLGERLEGEDPTQVEVIWEKTARAGGVFSGEAGRVGATAVSAVDQALWDIAGKALDVPVWRLLGGRHRERVRVYANLNRGTWDRTPKGFADMARRAVRAGFSAVKCTPFDEVHWRRQDQEGRDHSVEAGIERLRAVRRSIGPEIELLVDCHCRFDLPLALKVAEKAAPLDLYWFEEPVPRTQIDALCEISRLSGQRIAGGEGFFGREGFWEYISRGAVHVIMPDVKHAGGITECRRIAALAEIRQIPVSPHSPAGPVSTAAGVHLAASIPNFSLLEYAFGEVDWRADLVDPPERVEEGFIAVPDRPGLGIELNRAVLERHRKPLF